MFAIFAAVPIFLQIPSSATVFGLFTLRRMNGVRAHLTDRNLNDDGDGVIYDAADGLKEVSADMVRQ